MTDLPYRQAFNRIRTEYFEMPGMRLTAAQVERLTPAPRPEPQVMESHVASVIRSETAEPAELRMNRIAKRAHALYKARGGQHGTAVEDWLTAERQIDDEIERTRSYE